VRRKDRNSAVLHKSYVPSIFNELPTLDKQSLDNYQKAFRNMIAFAQNAMCEGGITGAGKFK
jgi:intergrase/recombinase